MSLYATDAPIHFGKALQNQNKKQSHYEPRYESIHIRFCAVTQFQNGWLKQW